MAYFRCYALNKHGRFVAAEDIETANLAEAIEAGWHFVGTCPATMAASGLEVWQGSRLVFSDPAGAGALLGAVGDGQVLPRVPEELHG